ncbi:MAG: dienelactone hydrolase family protein [Candidatus Promineifilaceae bacterium]|nr:dienelactone hydrolase family protein [Candidatus Promineifilaceae bacterium]
MKRIELMELVRERQVQTVSRRDFLVRASAVLGSAAAANTLLAACTSVSNGTPPPVVDSTQPAPEPGISSSDGLESGIVTYDGPEGTELMGYLAYQPGQQERPAIIVIQEWWGLNEHIQDVTRRFAEAGYVALAPDLYHGQVTTEPDEARKLAMELSMGDAVGEIQAAMAYLRAQDFTTDAIGLVGFCMGGGLVLQTAVADDSVGAAIPFYGQPVSVDQAEEISAPVQSFLGTRDGISASAYEAMHEVFSANGLPNHFQLYDGAQHSFFNDTRSSYAPEAASDAWTRTLAWFDEHLSPEI